MTSRQYLECECGALASCSLIGGKITSPQRRLIEAALRYSEREMVTTGSDAVDATASRLIATPLTLS
jgi:hypothetical protein